MHSSVMDRKIAFLIPLLKSLRSSLAEVIDNFRNSVLHHGYMDGKTSSSRLLLQKAGWMQRDNEVKDRHRGIRSAAKQVNQAALRVLTLNHHRDLLPHKCRILLQ
mmetsp:Transcript_37145/g.107017  ORF Transcript_37145/g.107017 Transcript_37145/m.107017 type:complete len:105 (-) Transcript_37145:480-794(-)